ncbi:hypothetical protein CRG98_010704 [Punica granatum]|uniref:RNase H type-1 domain-containing protein n=1 Tax=Punica granatum TaxID=22663 RepID=A0A2I0KK92_PUNGR|nr:hypothetical protein CRG98_010704 [Punica granatum]
MQRLRQYTLYHTIRLLSKADPLRYLLDSPSSMRNIVKWRCQLTEYDIEYVPCTSIKGQAIADHLAEFSIDDNTPINMDFSDEGILQIGEAKEEPTWKMYFDGAVNSVGSGVGAVLISPDGRHYPVAAKVDFSCTNNVAEYEACILMEAANKNIKKIIEKMTVNYKDWHEMLPYALLAYRTSIRTLTGATPYSLVYGMEAVLPIEVEFPSMKILAEAELAEAEWAKQRYEQLNLIDEKRLKALCHGQCYQQRMARAFNAKSQRFHAADILCKPFFLMCRCDREPRGMLPANGFMSASRGRSCTQGAGSRRGMRHTAQTDDVRRGRTNDSRPPSATAHEAVQTKRRTSHITQRPTQILNSSPFGPIPASFRSILVHSGLPWSIRVYPGLIQVHPGPFGSIPVSFRSILVIRVHPGSIRSKFRSFGSIRSKFRTFGSIGSKFRSFGSIPVIFKSILVHLHSGLSRSHSGLSWFICIWVYPGHIQVYPGSYAFGSIPVSFRSILVHLHSGLSRSRSGLSWFICIGVYPGLIQVYLGSSAFGSIPVTFRSILVHLHSGLSWFICIRVYPGSYAFGSIPVSFRSILVHLHSGLPRSHSGAQYGTLKIPLNAKVTNDTSRRVSGAYRLSRDAPDLSRTPFLTGFPGPAPLTSKRHPKTGLQAPRDHRGRGTSFRRPFGTLQGSPRDVSIVANASR